MKKRFKLITIAFLGLLGVLVVYFIYLLGNGLKLPIYGFLGALCYLVIGLFVSILVCDCLEYLLENKDERCK